MNVPLLDLKAQYEAVKGEITPAIMEVVEGQHFILGPKVAALEERVAAYSGARWGIGVSSGSDALLVALMALEVGPGDCVVTTPYTFFATAGAIVRLGATPVFVDIDPRTYNIDASRIEAAVAGLQKGKVKAVIPVHLFGQCCDMAAIMEISKAFGMAVIEDAAQAIGAKDKEGRPAGSIGDAGCFSFFPSKNLGGFGDGGLVTTTDAALAHRLKLIRNHGMEPKYYHHLVGANFRIDALQAAVLRVKLPHLAAWSDARRANAARYRALFAEAGLSDVTLPVEAPDRTHIYNQFVIRVPERDRLRQHLDAAGIGTEIYYPVPFHLQQCFIGLGYKAGVFPVAEAAAATSVALPIYPELTVAQQSTVVGAIRNFYRG